MLKVAPLVVNRYWTGYTAEGGQVNTTAGDSLGAMNSSLTAPYQHFVSYDNNATKRCVAANPRHSYYTYRWW